MKEDNRPFWQQRRDQKLSGMKPDKKTKHQKEKVKQKKSAKSSLDKWFDLQLATAPKFCENCNEALSKSMHTNPRTIIAHIVPKRQEYGCPSVATHPLNRWFACEDCHNRYDKGGQHAATMYIVDACKARLYHFIDLIPKEERRYIPKFLLNA